MNNKIVIICGARPNFMKIFPLHREMLQQSIDHFIINTGQHFSKEMSADFFEEFNIEVDYNLESSQESVIKQFSDILLGLEKIFLKEKPSLVIVVGDINSTLAGALVANKMNIKLVHIEAGLRSYNLKMPEEHNRVLTDRMADLLLTTVEGAEDNLKKEGIEKNIYFVGNLMIDTLNYFLPQIKDTEEEFYFCTLHRAENVDNQEVFREILDALEIISQDAKIYLPLHHRTKQRAEEFGFLDKMDKIFKILPSLSYQDSIFYQKNAKLVLTDSGGVQEETSFLGTPCLTLRTETERPITVELGTNIIAGINKESILKAYQKQNFQKKDADIPLWDSKTAQRIINIIKKNEKK
jgi:UDP-N-acetylglucosamine 2-epimerase (non-hydrolysing)